MGSNRLIGEERPEPHRRSDLVRAPLAENPRFLQSRGLENPIARSMKARRIQSHSRRDLEPVGPFR